MHPRAEHSYDVSSLGGKAKPNKSLLCCPGRKYREGIRSDSDKAMVYISHASLNGEP